MATVLVTGGAGFIGSHMVDLLLASGHNVAVADNFHSGFRENVNPAARLHEVDICTAALAGVFEQVKPEWVVHLAAQIDVTLSVREPIFDTQNNVLGSVNVLQQCIDHSVSKIVFSSTAGAMYGNPDKLPVLEDDPPLPLSHYATAKLCVEHYIRLYHALYGLPFTILRYPNVYGPRQTPHGEAGVCAILTGLMLDGQTPTLFGHGDPVRDYVYVGDIAHGTLLALEKGGNEVIILGSEAGTTVNEIFARLADLTGYTGEPNREPLRPGEVEAVYSTGARAREALGWTPEVSLAEGLRRTVDFIKSQRS